jgi:hypothetical protein
MSLSFSSSLCFLEEAGILSNLNKSKGKSMPGMHKYVNQKALTKHWLMEKSAMQLSISCRKDIDFST